MSVRAEWVQNGVPVCLSANVQSFQKIIGDGSGGVIVVWRDARNDNGDIYAQRVDGSAQVVWATNGIAVCNQLGTQDVPVVVSDGLGGAIVAWADGRSGTYSDIYAQRISAAGTLLWASGGVAICSSGLDQLSPSIVSDGLGGAILTWEDERSGLGSDIFGQRTNANGSPAWALNGVPICTTPSNQFYSSLLADNQSGAFITWTKSGIHTDVYVQHVNESGVIQWATDGVVACAAVGNQWGSRLADDGNGGIFVVWDDYRFDWQSDVFAQRVSALGVAQWVANGLPVATGVADQTGAVVASDGLGSAIVSWQDNRNDEMDVYAQRVTSSGTPEWTSNGVAVGASSGYQSSPSIVSDATGGAIIAWEDASCGLTCQDMYANRISASGSILWAANGAPVCVAGGAQISPMLLSDGWGGAFVAWQDSRSGVNSDDVYLQRMTPGGVIPTGVRKGPTPPSFVLRQNIPNPFSSETTVPLDLVKSATVRLEIYDVTGGLRRKWQVDLPSGASQLPFDGRDEVGRLLPSGIYFYRVGVNGTSWTRRMVIAR